MELLPTSEDRGSNPAIFIEYLFTLKWKDQKYGKGSVMVKQTKLLIVGFEPGSFGVGSYFNANFTTTTPLTTLWINYLKMHERRGTRWCRRNWIAVNKLIRLIVQRCHHKLVEHITSDKWRFDDVYIFTSWAAFQMKTVTTDACFICLCMWRNDNLLRIFTATQKIVGKPN